jgi:hypothetical protein
MGSYLTVGAAASWTQTVGSRSFERFAEVCAALAGVAGFGYSVAFTVFLHNASKGSQYAYSLLLLGGALFSVLAFVGVYGRLRDTDEGFALLGLPLAFAGA